MGDGQIFRASLFNKDLLNEPSFSKIHLAGQDSTFNMNVYECLMLVLYKPDSIPSNYETSVSTTSKGF